MTLRNYLFLTATLYIDAILITFNHTYVLLVIVQMTSKKKLNLCMLLVSQLYDNNSKIYKIFQIIDPIQKNKVFSRIIMSKRYYHSSN